MKRKRRRAGCCVKLQRRASFPLSLWKHLHVPHIHTPQFAAQSRLVNAELRHLKAQTKGCGAAETLGDAQGGKRRSFFLSNRYLVVLAVPRGSVVWLRVRGHVWREAVIANVSDAMMRSSIY
jgi:hypothetical protein